MSGNNMSNKTRELLIRELEAQDCTVKCTKKGWILFFPDGSSTVLHKTDSDRRALQNTKSRIKRAGITVTAI